MRLRLNFLLSFSMSALPKTYKSPTYVHVRANTLLPHINHLTTSTLEPYLCTHVRISSASGLYAGASCFFFSDVLSSFSSPSHHLSSLLFLCVLNDWLQLKWTGTEASRKEEPTLILTVLHITSHTHTHTLRLRVSDYQEERERDWVCQPETLTKRNLEKWLKHNARVSFF